MILNKWNFTTKEYEPFDSPATDLVLFTEDMDQQISCANCGTKLSFGESYTSRTIHTQLGIGYPVCKDCYAIEMSDNNIAELMQPSNLPNK